MANDQEGKKASRKKKEMESQVIDFFNREENIPYNYKQVSAAIGAETPKQRALVVEVLEELALEGMLIEVNPGRFKSKSRGNVATGTFVRRSNGKNSRYISYPFHIHIILQHNPHFPQEGMKWCWHSHM